MNLLRPLSPHLPFLKPQLTSTFSIYHRISGAFLATIVLFFSLLCMKIGFICFTYENLYQLLFYSSKFILISVEITALALSYHLFHGLRNLWAVEVVRYTTNISLIPLVIFLFRQLLPNSHRKPQLLF